MAKDAAEVAWQLFTFIAEKDPASVGEKEQVLATFKDCLAAVRDAPSAWGDTPSILFPDLDDENL